MERLICFNDIYRGKKILITGNTGFKGAWLTEWLNLLGADLFGFSDQIPTSPSLYESNKLSLSLKQYWGNLQDKNAVINVVSEIKPDFIFHLGAQALVKKSFLDPVETFATNTLGTVNILNAFRIIDNRCILIDVTSDKCYENVEWTWGYRENDRLGGLDPYSASKGAAELVFRSFHHSYFHGSTTKLAVSVRAGNVIGGGDWAPDRIIPDCFRSWINGSPVTIRSPNATRPWQHVLEPLSGYLRLGEMLFKDPNLNGESFNFGPSAEQNKTVLELINSIGNGLGNLMNLDSLYSLYDNQEFHEAALLKLNIDKALHLLKWKPTLFFEETAEFTSEWYKKYYFFNDSNMHEFSCKQIKYFVEIASKRNQPWVSNLLP